MLHSPFKIRGFDSITSVSARVSCENSFDSKQPKLEPKLVSALSETKLLFRLFRFYTETASFGVSIEPKQTEVECISTDQPDEDQCSEHQRSADQRLSTSTKIC